MPDTTPDARPDAATQLMITVDDRENRSGLPAALSRLWPRVAVGRLPVGDVEVGARILIERKTVQDFVASLADGRLYSQAYALNGACHRPLLIVEGTDATPFMSVPPRSLRGAFLTLAVGYRIPVLRTDDVPETAAFIAHLAEQETRRRERWAQRRADPPERTPQRVAMDVLGAIPGVGDLRARQLIDRFGAVGAVLAATETDLTDIPGVGPATARSVRRAAAPPASASASASARNRDRDREPDDVRERPSPYPCDVHDKGPRKNSPHSRHELSRAAGAARCSRVYATRDKISARSRRRST